MRTRSRKLRARLLIGALAVVAALAVGGVAWARGAGSPGYRTAAVTRGPVTATMTLAGTVTPVQSASVGFAQSGTVASVDVAAGQVVTAGQTLAQLDLTGLRAKLSQAQATEAAARQNLAEAEDGQLPTSGGGGSGGPATVASSSSNGSSGSRTGTSAGTAALQSAQQAVQSAQQAVDQAQSAARSAVSAAGTACVTGADPNDCQGAETVALGAENQLSARQSALAAAQSTLTQQLTKAATAAASAATPSTTSVSAVQLAQYQAAVDADVAAVAVAQQNLDQGTAVSPLSGTVVSVGLTPGETVSAASSTQVITVSSPNGYQVRATVPTADIGSVSPGQQASVVPDGGTAALSGSVTSISPTATSSGFAVVLGLSGTAASLRPGASATVTLTTGSATDAVVVPTSAVRSLGTRSLVEVLNGGTVQPALVTVGVRGPLRTQVLSGLEVGQRVVLADLSSTVTSDSSTTTGSRTGVGGAAGFGGAGRFAGGGAGLAGRRGTGG